MTDGIVCAYRYRFRLYNFLGVARKARSLEPIVNQLGDLERGLRSGGSNILYKV